MSLPKSSGPKSGFFRSNLTSFSLVLSLGPTPGSYKLVIRFHDLRATWATFLLGQGIAPAKVMAMGDWADLKTVMHYLRLAGIDVEGGSHPFDAKS
ncbi:MAG TPA: tyrosine-type recombinase/integrase [Bdellovibrio sp.]|uniref:tyrosine-type recombinase/integrase n=1 Tax=Bdellovibrio sp. TaxID=28201 RepID=UPI002EF2D7A7